MSKLPIDLEQLLEGERARTELSPDALDSAWNALHATVLKVDAAAPAPPPPAPPSALPDAASWTARALWTGAAAVVFGTGVVVGRATAPSPPPPPPPAPVVSVAPPAIHETVPVPAITTEPTASAAPAPPPRLPTAAPSSAKRVDAPPAASSAAPSTLADERALVEGARTALLRGRAADALSLAQKHQSSFPDGGLAEDRDFLIVSALRDLGRGDESRVKAAAFLARYPKSALRSTVETMAR